ncbi:AbrB/MazE/SpoVT family DNA-binding domain-containing protein [Desulfoscipio geothermicus]|uniref:Transcriptional regulator, AbrB family n=1 Tax=Desulfoscipio geothermicus DSM 3669 TaxID=1121426 RepID=A0A1I6DDT9_9FIRM|nr:AbrB/MazE/SpoVT family DNA-binding domain-containing protein [Desulfoscipio geothermicus]SFR03531.1 transcriptional regulator, AbrB family [Desulfoscipio geothermicus DSM 3669]
MQYELVKLTSKGQLTLPKEYRDKLCLEKGSHLAVAMKGDTLMLKKVYTVKPLSDSDPIWDMVGMFEDCSGAAGVAADHDACAVEGVTAGWKKY